MAAMPWRFDFRVSITLEVGQYRGSLLDCPGGLLADPGKKKKKHFPVGCVPQSIRSKPI